MYMYIYIYIYIVAMRDHTLSLHPLRGCAALRWGVGGAGPHQGQPLRVRLPPALGLCQLLAELRDLLQVLRLRRLLCSR